MGGKESSRKIVWVKWELVYLNKSVGGLGVKYVKFLFGPVVQMSLEMGVRGEVIMGEYTEV